MAADTPREPSKGVTGFEYSESSIKEPTESARETAEALRERGRYKKEQWKEEAKKKTKSKVAEQASRAARELGATAEALRQTGQRFREQDKPRLARYSESVAERTENLSHYLSEKDVNQFIADAEDFVRRQPMVAIGGAFFVGAILARFLKASGRKAKTGPEERELD